MNREIESNEGSKPNDSARTHETPRVVVFWGAVLGFVMPFLILSAPLWVEYFKRLAYYNSGGRGEGAAYGEMLFYMGAIAPFFLIGVPVGGLAARLLWQVYARRAGCQLDIEPPALNTKSLPHED
jgi:hypothetical protein